MKAPRWLVCGTTGRKITPGGDGRISYTYPAATSWVVLDRWQAYGEVAAFSPANRPRGWALREAVAFAEGLAAKYGGSVEVRPDSLRTEGPGGTRSRLPRQVSSRRAST